MFILYILIQVIIGYFHYFFPHKENNPARVISYIIENLGRIIKYCIQILVIMKLKCTDDLYKLLQYSENFTIFNYSSVSRGL